MTRVFAALASALMVGGCAGLVFHQKPQEGALMYYDPEPYFFVATTGECVTTATVVNVPAHRRSVSLHSGYGSADLSVTLSNGMIASVGQKTDTKVPETLTAVANLATAVGIKGMVAAQPSKCEPTAKLYPISPKTGPGGKPVEFPVTRIP